MSMNHLPADILENAASLKDLPPSKKRMMDLLRKGSNIQGYPKSWSLDFCLAPTRFEPDPEDPSRIGRTEFEKMTLVSPLEASARPEHTGETLTVPSSVAFRSIGYKLTPMPEFAELSISFDDSRGIIRNDGLGRVMGTLGAEQPAIPYKHFPGLYCAGWARRGPTGTIASTMMDAFSTAESLAQDWQASGESTPFLHEKSGTMHNGGWEGVRNEMQASSARIVHWGDWQKIDRAEKERAEADGKPREKFTRVKDMLSALD